MRQTESFFLTAAVLALCSAPYPSPISSILFPSRLSFPEKVPTCSEKDIASRSPMTMAMEPGDGPHCANAIQQLRGTALCSGNGQIFRGNALASCPRNCSIQGDSFDALESKLGVTVISNPIIKQSWHLQPVHFGNPLFPFISRPAT